MDQTYIIQGLLEGEWQPVCNSPDMQGIVENLIDMNNEGLFMEEPCKWRLVQWVEGRGTKVIYEKEEQDGQRP